MASDELNHEIVSDESVLKVTGQIVLGQTILVAYSLGLFSILASNPLSVEELANQLKLNERAVQGMIACGCSMDFIECNNGIYQLTPCGRSFFDEKSPTYYGGAFDLLIDHNEIMNFSSIREAILSNASQADEGKDIFHGDDSLGSTKAFVRELHQKAVAPALHWVKQFDLSEYSSFVDIAGGSGMHTIAACLENRALKGTVCERKGVLRHTADYIKSFDLEDRIEMQEVDLWTSEFPKGDVFFLADIFHDWDREKCILLAKKCYQAMSEGGKLILHEMLFNETKTGSSLTAAYNMKMLLWTEGQQYSFQEIAEILDQVGFKNIRKEKALGNWSLVIGDKAL